MSFKFSRNYEQLSVNRKISQSKIDSGGMQAFFCLVSLVVLMGVWNPQTTTTEDQASTTLAEWMQYAEIQTALKIVPGIVAIILGLKAYVNLRDGYAQKPDNQLIPAIRMFEAYHSVRTLSNTEGLLSDRRKAAKEVLSNLRLYILGWKHSTTPELLAKPIWLLASGIESKLIPAVMDGNKEQIQLVEQSLFDFVRLFDKGITWEEFVALSSQLDALPTISSRKNQFVEFFKNNDLAKPVTIGLILGGIIGGIVYSAEGGLGVSITTGTSVAAAVVGITIARAKKATSG